MAIKEVDQKSYDELINDLQNRYGRVRTRFDLHIVGEDESPSELTQLKGLIDSLSVEDKNLIKKIDEINKRLESIEVGNIDLSGYVTKTELPDLLPPTGHLLTESEASEIYAKKTDIPQPQDLTEYAKKSELPDTSNLLTEYQADAKYVLNSEMASYARKTDIPQPQDLSEYAKKSEIVEPDLTPYVKKSELTQPDLEPYETKEHAVQTYVNKSELPDLSIYALKSELENLSQGGSTNLTAKDISKLLTLKPITYYEQLMDSGLVFVNDSDKPVTITIQEYDYTQSSPQPLIEKEYTFQPHEEWQSGYEFGFSPQKQEGTYPELNVEVDGEKIVFFTVNGPNPRWGLKCYMNPIFISAYLASAKHYQSKQAYLLTPQTLTQNIVGRYGELNFIETRPKGSRVYFQSEDVQGYNKSKQYINGSTIKVLYENSRRLNGDVEWKLTTESTVATDETRSVFYKGLLKGIYDAETGDNVTSGFENKSVIAVYEITDPRWGIK